MVNNLRIMDWIGRVGQDQSSYGFKLSACITLQCSTSCSALALIFCSIRPRSRAQSLDKQRRSKKYDWQIHRPNNLRIEQAINATELCLASQPNGIELYSLSTDIHMNTLLRRSNVTTHFQLYLHSTQSPYSQDAHCTRPGWQPALRIMSICPALGKQMQMD